METTSKNTMDRGHRELIQQTIAPRGEARPDGPSQTIEEGFPQSKEDCVWITRAHFTLLNELMSFRHIIVLNPETEVDENQNGDSSKG